HRDLHFFPTRRSSDLEVVDPVWLSKAWRDGFFVDLITGMSNGIITVEDSWIEGSARAKVTGVQTRVLAAEELIASKMFVLFRERDRKSTRLNSSHVKS